jgi:hypothetical protein
MRLNQAGATLTEHGLFWEENDGRSSLQEKRIRSIPINRRGERERRSSMPCGQRNVIAERAIVLPAR